MLDIERADIVLTTVSPIHIKGSGREYGLGLVKKDPDDSRAYVINPEKLLKLLSSKGKTGAFLDTFSTPDSFRKPGLRKFLEDHRLLTDENLKQISSAVTVSMPEKSFICDGKG